MQELSMVIFKDSRGVIKQLCTVGGSFLTFKQVARFIELHPLLSAKYVDEACCLPFKWGAILFLFNFHLPIGLSIVQDPNDTQFINLFLYDLREWKWNTIT